MNQSFDEIVGAVITAYYTAGCYPIRRMWNNHRGGHCPADFLRNVSAGQALGLLDCQGGPLSAAAISDGWEGWFPKDRNALCGVESPSHYFGMELFTAMNVRGLIRGTDGQPLQVDKDAPHYLVP